MTFVVGVVLFAVAFAISKLPIETCPECRHCQEKKRLKLLEQERLKKEYARSIGLIDDKDSDDEQGGTR